MAAEEVVRGRRPGAWRRLRAAARGVVETRDLSNMVPIGLDNLLTLALGLLGLRLVSRFVPPSVFGQFTLFSTLPRLAILATHAGILAFATRHWGAAAGRRGTLMRVILRGHGRSSVPLLAVLAVIVGGFALNHADATWLVVMPLIATCCVGEALNVNVIGVLQASRRYWAACLVSVAGTLLKTVLPVLGVLAVGTSFGPMIGGYTVYVLAALLLGAWTLRGDWRDEGLDLPARRWEEEMAGFSVPFLLVGTGTWLLFSVDRWIAILVFGQETGGQFALAFSLGSVLPGMISATIGQLRFPEIYRRADAANSEEEWRRLFRLGEGLTWLYVVASLAALLALIELVQVVGRYLVARRYEQALGLVFPAGCAYMGSQIFLFQHFVLVGRRRQWAVVEIIGWMAAMKILGSLLSALVSLDAFVAWQVVSVVVFAVANRHLARRRLLGRADEAMDGGDVRGRPA